MRFKPFACLVATLLGLSSGVAHATLLVPAYSGTYDGASNLNDITLTLASTVASPTSPATISVEDIRGTAALVDSVTAGFDFLTAGPAPLPNSLLLGLNASLAQEVLLSFDFAPADMAFGTPFYTGNVIAAAIGVPVGTVTDPALSPLIGTNFFAFSYQPALSTPANGVLVYGLTAILPSASPVPEPSSILLFALGAPALFLAVRRRPRTAFRS